MNKGLKRVVGAWLLVLGMSMGMPQTVNAENLVKVYEEDALPIPGEVKEDVTEADSEDTISYVGPSMYSFDGLLGDPGNGSPVAEVKSYAVNIDSYQTTDTNANWTYSASTPVVVSFYDGLGRYNVAYMNSVTGDLQIQRYDESFQLVNQLQIAPRYSLFGNVTCDAKGYYYVVWGQQDSEETNCVTMCVSKYNYSGKLIAECAMKGYETAPYYFGDNGGTKLPFRSANCSITINNGILACNYGRQMYNGHQSNYMFYVDCNTMKRITVQNVPYTSHSFDQRVIGLPNGKFLAVDQGDAYSRGFTISLAEVDGYYQALTSFHFREGSNRSYGYNETYAQLGGIAETAKGYVLCGSSERTLSLENAPTGGGYCGYSEARDLFVQIIKKDFYEYSGAEKYLVSGATRKATGTRPTDSQSELFLNGNEVDYGVLWLTDYDDAYYAANPKVLVTPDNKIVIMWEKLAYSTHTGKSYYAILNENGTVYQDTKEIPGVRLAGNIDPVYKDGKIYWTTTHYSNGDYIHELTVLNEVENVTPQKPYKINNVVSGIHVYWKKTGNATKYGVWRSTTKDGTYKWITNTSATNFTDKAVESGKTYFYKISVYNPQLDKHSDKSEALGMLYVGTPDLTLRVNRSTGIGLGWNQISGATGYAIYRKSYAGYDSWVRVATIKNPKTLTWTDESVKDKNGIIYRYTVRALGGANHNYLSGCRTGGRTMVRMTTRTFLSATKVSSTSAKCKWMTTSASDGYEVRFMVGSKVYKTYTVGNYKTGEKTFTGLKAGQTYKVQVRSYKKVNGVGTFYSAWSAAKSVGL